MELKGKYAEAVVYTDFVENEAISQIINILNQPIMEDVKVRIMPDVHAGAGICIGYTATLNNYVVPNFIGVDIGCGLTAVPIPKETILIFEKLDNFIRNNIPSGNSVNQKVNDDISIVWGKMDRKKLYCTNPDEYFNRMTRLCDELSIDNSRVILGIGSLGGGNHFISVNRKDDGQCFLVVHSGSRNLGKCIAGYHQKKAVIDDKSVIGYLTGQDKDSYLDDMKFAQTYAALNRRVMLYRIAKYLGMTYEEEKIIESVHNYINFEDGIIRKGAISANLDEEILIPLSMADGILYCRGKGNPEWNCSAPHGAGRLMSRSNAKKTISLDDYRKRMEDAGVWTSCVGTETLDEAPQAYKNPAMIKDVITDTAEIVGQWCEIYNFKAV